MTNVAVQPRSWLLRPSLSPQPLATEQYPLSLSVCKILLIRLSKDPLFLQKVLPIKCNESQLQLSAHRLQKLGGVDSLRYYNSKPNNISNPVLFTATVEVV